MPSGIEAGWAGTEAGWAGMEAGWAGMEVDGSTPIERPREPG